MSSFFFLSALFTIFAPLPLLLFYLRSNLRWLLLAILTNTLIVTLLGGLWSGLLFLIFVGFTTFAISYGMVQKKFTLEKTIGIALLILSALLGVAVFYAIQHPGESWIVLIKETYLQVTAQVHEMAQKSGNSEWIDIPLTEFQKDILSEVPSSFAILVVIMMWINVSLLISINPRNVRKWLGMDAKYFRKWKAPEWLVWPTIIVGAVSVWGHGWIAGFCAGFLKFFMTVYVLQGIAIMAFFLDRAKVFGLFRSLIYIGTLIMLMPLVLGVGFFDLWFDFRAKFRQT